MSTSLISPTAPTGPMIGLLSDSSLTQLVNDALRNYHSTLALSRSALANSALVAPTLVKDEASPTVEERGYGLRLVLQWAVEQLAPGTLDYPLGEYRPLDDPTWRDPRWWRYNILRHRYLEPLHPDDFVDGGRYTESLLALTGISSTDTFFDERNRAIRDVAERLRQQFIDGSASEDLQRLALHEAMLPLERQAEPARLLGIAATFDDIFPRRLLIDIAQREVMGNPEIALDDLTKQRFLLTGDAGSNLWLSPVVRAYVYERQSEMDRQRRHHLAATYYETQGMALLAANHWRRARQDARAVRILLPAIDELIHELQVKAVIDLFQQFEARRLEHDQWYTVQLLLSDLLQRSGQVEDALAACRHALQASEDLSKQGRVYRRMGKLYESRNQLHALRYYQQAVERLAPTDPDLAELLKDRGWLYILRQEWEKAEQDLLQAQQIVAVEAKVLRGDIYDAMANLYRKMGEIERALVYAERALAIREEGGDLLQIAKSHANLGLFYRAMQENNHAIAAYREAMSTYQKIGNQEVMAIMLLNIGAAYFHDKCTDEAIGAYQQSLAISQAINLPLIELKAHYNLAEAFMASHLQAEALHHWQVGYQLCRRHNFDDQEADFLELQRTMHRPATDALTPLGKQPTALSISAPTTMDTDEETILTLVRREHSLTPKRLMSAANISRATATRRLTALVEKGWLEKQGEGRATAYRLPTTTPSTTSATLLTTTPVIIAPTPTVDQLQTLLQQQQQLYDEFDVDALTVVAPPAPVLVARVQAHFTRPPDLAHYLQLKEHLRHLLEVEVDLLVGES